jgi:hypothetical protein
MLKSIPPSAVKAELTSEFQSLWMTSGMKTGQRVVSFMVMALASTEDGTSPSSVEAVIVAAND